MATTRDQPQRAAPTTKATRPRPSWATGSTIGLPLLVVALFVLLPLGLVGVYSVYTLNEMTGLMQRDFSSINYRDLIERDIYRRVLWRTFEIAGVATLIALIIGYPVGYALGTVTNARRQSILLLLILVPFWSSYIVRTYAWIGILRSDGFLQDIFGWIPGFPADLLYTRTAVLIGFVHVFLPLMILPIYASTRNLDRRLIEASHDLGAPPWRTFMRVTFPLTLPGILGGSILFFIPCFGSFVTPTLLGGPSDRMIGNVVQSQFGEAFNWPFGSAMAMVMTIIVIIGIAIFFRVARTEEIYG